MSPAAEDAAGARRSTSQRAGGWPRKRARRLDNRPGGVAQHRLADAQARLHPAEVFRALRPFVETRSRHGADLRRRRVRAMGPEHAAGRPPLINGVTGSIGSCAVVCARGAAGGTEARRCSRCWATAPSASTCPSSRPRCGAACRSSRCSATTRAGTPRARSSSATTAPTAMHGCELLPTRYDQVVAALGGHGELVTQADDLPGAHRARARQRQAGLHQRHDREHRRAEPAPGRMSHPARTMRIPAIRGWSGWGNSRMPARQEVSRGETRSPRSSRCR